MYTEVEFNKEDYLFKDLFSETYNALYSIVAEWLNNDQELSPPKFSKIIYRQMGKTANSLDRMEMFELSNKIDQLIIKAVL